jgi:hypothetical protein
MIIAQIMADVGSKILMAVLTIIAMLKVVSAVVEIMEADQIITATHNRAKVVVSVVVEIMEADLIQEAASLKRDIKR